MKRSWVLLALCALGGGLMSVATAHAQAGTSTVQAGADEALKQEAAREAPERESAAESILARAEAAAARPFDAAFRAQVKADLASRSLEHLAAIQEKGAGWRPLIAGDSASDLVFVPVTPCRIIDTRSAGGPITAGTTRSFLAAASNYSGQGGFAGSCGIPFGPTTAIAVNLVAVNAAGAGDLRAFPFNGAVPTASVVNYAKVTDQTLAGVPLNVANAIILKICDPVAPGCTFDFTIQADVNATQVVADIMGYFENFQPDTFRRNSATFVAIPSNGNVQVTSVTFTPRFTGNALVRARGYCNITTDATTNEIDMYVGTTLADAQSASVADWGVIRPAVNSGFYQLMYSAERVMTMTRGTAQTIGLFGAHFGTGATNCSGAIVVESLF